MLPAAIRYKLLFGPYRTPRFKVGAIVIDAIRGKVKIVGVSDARIPWPVSMAWTRRSPVIYGGLAKALRLESLQAVVYWWGISGERVRVWRRKLGIPMYTLGTELLRKQFAQTPAFCRMLRKAWANAGSPERRESNRKGLLAMYRMKRTHGTWPPTAGRLPQADAPFRRWTAKELAMLTRLPVQEIAQRTGRTRQAIYQRRRKLESAGR